jgi:hypothetical protein
MRKFLKYRLGNKSRNTPVETISTIRSNDSASHLRPSVVSTSASTCDVSREVSTDVPSRNPTTPADTIEPENTQTNAEQRSDTPPSLAGAEARLKEAARKLQTLIPEDVLQCGELKFNDIEGCADINSLADNVGLAIATLMDQRNVEKSNQSAVKTLMKGWVKKVLPFIQQGLSFATVSNRVTILVTIASDPRALHNNRIGPTLYCPGYQTVFVSDRLERTTSGLIIGGCQQFA